MTSRGSQNMICRKALPYNQNESLRGLPGGNYIEYQPSSNIKDAKLLSHEMKLPKQ